MDSMAMRAHLQGCYVTIPTMFRDDAAFSIDFDAIRRHVAWVIEGGCVAGDAVLLAGGAAGEFSTLTFDERVAVARTVVEAAAGRVPVAMGGQTTSTLELIRLAQSAEQAGAEFLQVSPPYYFDATEGDFYEHVLAVANASKIGLIIYNTFWTSLSVSSDLVQKLADIPNVVGLKWATSDTGMIEYEQVVSRFSGRFAIIDNQTRYVNSHILGARCFEIHQANYWPQWSVGLWHRLERHEYAEVQNEMVRVAMPFMELITEMLRYTGGEGYLEKLCMELLGRDSSRNRPPTRDVRHVFREQTRQMLLQTGVPGVLPA